MADEGFTGLMIFDECMGLGVCDGGEKMGEDTLACMYCCCGWLNIEGGGAACDWFCAGSGLEAFKRAKSS